MPQLTDPSGATCRTGQTVAPERGDASDTIGATCSTTTASSCVAASRAVNPASSFTSAPTRYVPGGRASTGITASALRSFPPTPPVVASVATGTPAGVRSFASRETMVRLLEPEIGTASVEACPEHASASWRTQWFTATRVHRDLEPVPGGGRAELELAVAALVDDPAVREARHDPDPDRGAELLAGQLHGERRGDVLEGREVGSAGDGGRARAPVDQGRRHDRERPAEGLAERQVRGRPGDARVPHVRAAQIDPATGDERGAVLERTPRSARRSGSSRARTRRR